MFESMVVTLREGVEAALIIAIVLAYLGKIGRIELARSVYWGLAAAIATSVAGAVLFNRIEINEEQFEGWTMLTASAFIATMIIWMWRAAKRLKADIETRVGDLAANQNARFSFGLFAFVFIMVVREGIETVLLLSAVQLNTSAVMSFVGGLLGLIAAVVFGALFVKGAVRVNLRKFFSVTSVILIIVAIQLFISGLHELSEALVLPSSAEEMAIIGPIVKSQAFFYVVVLGLTVFMILWQRQKPPAATPADANPAERRKAIHLARRERFLTISLATLGLVAMVMITAQFVYSMNAGELSSPEETFERGTEVRMPVSRLNDGNLHRFSYKASDREVRFIMMKLASGEIAVALDACEICGDKGYFQQGSDVICKNCIAPINPASIGQPGGCNPIPLKSRLEDSEIVVPYEELDAGASHFTHPGQVKQ